MNIYEELEKKLGFIWEIELELKKAISSALAEILKKKACLNPQHNGWAYCQKYSEDCRFYVTIEEINSVLGEKE